MAAEKMTKAKLLKVLSDETGLNKLQVESVLNSLHGLLKTQLGKKGPGEFTIPRIVKLKVVKKKATKARTGRNPATGDPIKIKPKRAHNVVKATVLKATKDAV